MNNKGFTLIELLVVVLIIGILSAVALPQYQDAVEKARISEALTTGKAMSDSILRYNQANPGKYPSKKQELDVDLNPANWTNATTYTTKLFVYTINQANGSVTIKRQDKGTTGVLYTITVPMQGDKTCSTAISIDATQAAKMCKFVEHAI